MSEVNTIIEIVREFGFSAVAVYMMFRMENRLQELIVKIEELCTRLTEAST